ncbi:hypothetical protein STENM223S_02825 [Streptomyces tendae]
MRPMLPALSRSHLPSGAVRVRAVEGGARGGSRGHQVVGGRHRPSADRMLGLICGAMRQGYAVRGATVRTVRGLVDTLYAGSAGPRRPCVTRRLDTPGCLPNDAGAFGRRDNRPRRRCGPEVFAQLGADEVPPRWRPTARGGQGTGWGWAPAAAGASAPFPCQVARSRQTEDVHPRRGLAPPTGRRRYTHPRRLDVTHPGVRVPGTWRPCRAGAARAGRRGRRPGRERRAAAAARRAARCRDAA